MKNVGAALAAAALAVFAPGRGAAAGVESDSTGALIQGFAKYQASRVEKLVLNEFLNDLAKNELIVQFFPDTSFAMKEYNGATAAKRLLPLIQFYVQQDLNRLGDLATCLSPGNETNKSKDPLAVRFTLNADTAPPFVKRLREFKTDFQKGKSTPEGFLDERNCPQDGSEKGVHDARLDYADQRAFLKAMLTLNEPENFLHAAMAQQPGDALEKVSEEETIAALVALKNIWLLRKSQHPADGIRSCKDLPPMAAVLDQMYVALKELGFDRDRPYQYARFKDQSLFLGSLADAACTGDADTVAKVVADYVDDQDAFRDKRSAGGLLSERACTWLVNCRNALFVGSYFGLSAAYADKDGNGDKTMLYGVYGPVGLEAKLYRFGRHPLTLGVAPIDLGAYISNELRGESYTAKLDDIKAPSYFLAYSAANRPFALIVGYQRRVMPGTSDKVGYGFLSISFDLPLITIY